MIKSDNFTVKVTRKKVKYLRMRQREGVFYISAPLFVSNSSIDKFIKNNHIWMQKQLIQEAKKPNQIIIQYEEFCELTYSLIEKYQNDLQITNDLRVKDVRFRKMTSRWGVCNITKRIITISTELMKYYENCLEYVVAHEVVHLLHKNHNKIFWQTVGKIYPNYHNVRKILRNDD